MPLFDDETTRSMVKAIGADAVGTYTPAEGGVGVEIDIDFRNEYEAAALMNVKVEDSKPIAFVVTSDLTGTIFGGTLLVGSITYKIIGNQPDAEGQTMLILSEVSP